MNLDAPIDETEERRSEKCVIDHRSPETCMRKKEGFPEEPFHPIFSHLKKMRLLNGLSIVYVPVIFAYSALIPLAISIEL